MSGNRSDRRLKATIVVLLVWGIVSLLHWRPETQWLRVVLTAVLTIQAIRMLIAKPHTTSIDGNTDLLTVSILVPAKNESAVLTNLVHSLFRLDYPTTHLDIWIVDDGSTDATPQILQELQTKFPGLHIRFNYIYSQNKHIIVSKRIHLTTIFCTKLSMTINACILPPFLTHPTLKKYD